MARVTVRTKKHKNKKSKGTRYRVKTKGNNSHVVIRK